MTENTDKTQPTPSAVFQQMHDLTRQKNYSSYDERIKLLKALRQAVLAQKSALATAINQDFSGRSSHETTYAEIIPTVSAIDYLIKHLRKWMKPKRKSVALHFMPAKNSIQYQPKGVVLIVSPWNYPVTLSIIPLATALAAGNRAVLKPSECCPATSTVLADLVGRAVPNDRATTITGGADVSAELCSLAFDHIVFTGSTRVGRMVMQAAAKNLTPVTLELGGKSPAVIHPDYDMATAAERIARGKLLNAGQTCIAPDYVMVASDKLQQFTAEYKKAVATFYPAIEGNKDYSSIINQQGFDRLNGLLTDAKNKGATVQVVGSDKPHSATRTLHPHIVLDMSDDMDIAKEEIFGPVLPVVTYDNIDQASQYINSRPRPLALYYFDKNQQRCVKFLQDTVSGGAAINDTVLHFAQDDLPFGGIGPSGMGVCHGFEGFAELSHAKSVFRQSPLNGTKLLDPPYGKRFNRIARFLLR